MSISSPKYLSFTCHHQVEHPVFHNGDYVARPQSTQFAGFSALSKALGFGFYAVPTSNIQSHAELEETIAWNVLDFLRTKERVVTIMGGVHARNIHRNGLLQSDAFGYAVIDQSTNRYLR